MRKVDLNKHGIKDRRLRHFSYRSLAVMSVFFLAVSLVPVLYCSFFDYATGDDFGYSAGVHIALEEGRNLLYIVRLIMTDIRNSYYSYQGTWSSLFLFHLQPGIYGERVYTIVPWIALTSFLLGTGYFLYEAMVHILHYTRAVFCVVFCGLSVLSIQYMPKMRGGLFWYTSVAHYLIPYCVCMLCFAWSLKWIASGERRYLAAMSAGMAYLGGAGYPTIVASAAWLFFLILFECIRGRHLSGKKINVFLLLIPFMLLMTGFGISAAAPGNRNRGGAEFGFHLTWVFQTVLDAVVQTFSGIPHRFVEVRILILYVAALILFSLDPSAYLKTSSLPGQGMTGIPGEADTNGGVTAVKKRKKEWFHPALIILAGFLICCGVRMPEIYAGDSVSGGVPDTYFFFDLLFITLAALYLTSYLRRSSGLCREYHVLSSESSAAMPLLTFVFLLCAFLGTLFSARHFIGGTVDYTCITFVREGHLADFESQMEERLAILEDDSIRDAVVPEMNPEQGPFMHMALLRDPDAFTNRVTAEYYEKNSVTAIPREEWNAMRGQQNETESIG